MPDSDALVFNTYLMFERVVGPLLDKINWLGLEVKVRTPEEGIKVLSVNGVLQGQEGGDIYEVDLFQSKGENEVKYEASVKRKELKKMDEEDHGGAYAPSEAG